MLDNKLVFADSMAITGAAATFSSTHILDMGPLATGNLYRNLAVSELFLITRFEVTLTSGGSATVSVRLMGDNNSAMSSGALILQQSSLVAYAGITAGTVYKTPLPRVNMERYLQVEYIVGTAALTAGTVSSWLSPTAEGDWYAYNKNAGESNSF